MDAIELLEGDHQEVTRLFQRFSAARNRRGEPGVAKKICQALEVHSQIEEEIFYPAVRAAGEDLAKQVDEAEREHAQVKRQVSAIQAMIEREANADLTAPVSALQKDVEHHVVEEEGEMFPRVTEAMDARERTDLGRQMTERKRELMGGGGRGRATSRRSPGRTARRTRTTPRRTKTARTKTRGRKTARKRARAGRGR